MIHQVSYQTRLDWAGQHLQSLEAEVRRWQNGSPCRVWTEFDLQSGNNLLWAEVVRQPPHSIGMIIGDCLHNLRSALDNLAYELALAYQKGPLSRSMAGDSGFPIFLTDDADSAKKLKRMIRGIHPDAKTLIKGLQPYNRWGENDTLWALRELSNTDKHKLPHMTVVMPETLPYFTTDLSSLSAGVSAFTSYWEPLEGRAVIAEYPYPTPPYTKMYMQRPATFTVAFGELAPDVVQGWGVRAIVRQIRDYIIRDVAPPLIRYLG